MARDHHDTIRKLRAITTARGATPGEAANAADAVAKLVARHGEPVEAESVTVRRFQWHDHASAAYNHDQWMRATRFAEEFVRRAQADFVRVWEARQKREREAAAAQRDLHAEGDESQFVWDDVHSRWKAKQYSRWRAKQPGPKRKRRESPRRQSETVKSRRARNFVLRKKRDEAWDLIFS